jgi:hypothetical protein
MLFCLVNNNIIAIPIELISMLIYGDFALFVTENILGSNLSCANPNAICPEVKVHAFNVPRQIINPATPIMHSAFEENAIFAKSTYGAFDSAKILPGIVPIIPIQFARYKSAVQTVPNMIAKGIFLPGFFTAPAGAVPHSTPINPQNASKETWLIIEEFDISEISLLTSKFDPLKNGIVKNGIVNNGANFSKVKTNSSLPEKLTLTQLI